MSLNYESIELSCTYSIGTNESIEAFETDHTVPSCGYIVTKENRAVLISADTYALDSVIEAVNNNKDIQTLVLECSFPSAMFALAKASKHLTPALLFERLKKLENRNLKLYINHLKPSHKETLIKEIENAKGVWDVTILGDGDKVYF
jgi:phosphoribosyl 1,2-cyclic phosphodiesterase